MKLQIMALAITSLVFFAGCSVERTGIMPPCGKEGLSRVELGRPRVISAPFTTAGGDLYLTASGFGHGAVGQPKVGSTRLYVGEGEVKGTRPGRVPDNTLLTLDVVEDDFVQFELAAGAYWVVTTNDASLAVVSCEEAGVKEVVAQV